MEYDVLFKEWLESMWSLVLCYDWSSLNHDKYFQETMNNI